jgi:type IV pilus assembly protein PilE
MHYIHIHLYRIKNRGREAPKNKKNRVKAFTLTELLVVLIIIGILVLIAIPNLMPLISNARATEAKLQLQHIYTLQKTYFMENAKYSASIHELNYEPEKLSTEGGSANYKIDIIDAGTKSFTARATAVADFDGDGNYNVWEIDENKKLTEVTKD